MGRVPGVYNYIKSAADWKREVAEEKRLATIRVPNPPLATLAAAKRRVLLLWFISEFFEGKMAVNITYMPIYTKDMKQLVRDKLLDLKRKNGVTVLTMTKRADELIQSLKLKQQEKDWIIQSFNSHSLR